MERIRRAQAPLLLSLLLLVSACGKEGYRISALWQAERENLPEGTLVRTVNGSVWRGAARLELQAVIGGQSDPEGQTLVRPEGVAVDTVRRRIFILDSGAHRIQAFDFNGNHLFTAGREGQGPGEFDYAQCVAVDSDSGRFFVFAYIQGRLLIFRPDGVFEESIPVNPLMLYPPTVLCTSTRHVYLMQRIQREPGGNPVRGLVRVWPTSAGPDTLIRPEVEGEVSYLTAGYNSLAVPFWPERAITSTPNLSFVYGFADRYRFTISNPDATDIIVEVSGQQVPVFPEEAAWHRRYATLYFQEMDPAWIWDGKPIPNHKPAFSSFYPDPNGRIWVHRPGPGRRLEGGVEDPPDLRTAHHNPCWENTVLIDVFDREGRFLGPVEIDPAAPSDFRVVYAHNRMVIADTETGEGAPRFEIHTLIYPRQTKGMD